MDEFENWGAVSGAEYTAEVERRMRHDFAELPAGRISEDLRAAAGYILTHGWLQGDASNHHGNVCMAGSLGRICDIEHNGGDDTFAVQRYNAAMVALSDFLGVEVIGGVPEYNDAAERTKYDCVTTFEKAAAWVEETK